MLRLMLVSALALQIGNGAASSVGRHFLGAFMTNDYFQVDSLVVDIVSYDNTAQVNVSVPGLPSQSVVLPPFSSTYVTLPITAQITSSGIVTGEVVSVDSDNAISVWGRYSGPYTHEGFMMIPLEGLGIAYDVVAPWWVSGNRNEFAIVSPYNNVTVQISLTYPVTFNGISYNNDLSVTLQQNQVVQFQGPSLTDTRIISSKPVAVFSGDWCFGRYTGCSFVTEQLLPVGQWGSSYLVFPVSIKSKNDMVLISSSTNADIIINYSISGSSTRYTLSRYLTLAVAVYSNQTLSINASANVGVMYICEGGDSNLGNQIYPFQMNIIPTNKFSNIYLFSTQPSLINMLTVITKDEDKCGIIMNGERLCDKIQWMRINDLQFVAGELNLGSEGRQILVQHPSQPFGLYLYGWGTYDSFGYPLGYDNIRGVLCGSNLTAGNGTIGFADIQTIPYVGDCFVTITGATGSSIILRFQSFSLQEGMEFVYIYDGPSTNSTLLGRYSGVGNPDPIISSSNTLTIRATYNRAGIVGTFSAFYRAGSPCKQSYTGSEGLISSDNFPAVNETNALCWWSVEVDPRYQVKLHFLTFNLSAEGDCGSESLTAYDNSGSLGRFCGSATPPGLRSTTNSLLLVLDSAQGLRAGGVSVNFAAINPIQTSTHCGSVNVSGLSAWPWQVTVLRIADNASCTGSLISDSWVLTAAHCLQDSPSNYAWSCGTASGELVNVSGVRVHERFAPGSLDYDVALLQLSRPVAFGQSVQAVCLPWQREQTPVMGRSCHALGLRRADGSLPSAPAAEGNVRFVSDSTCGQVHGNLTSRMLCVAKRHGWADGCQLGLGGGLYCLGSDRVWYITGIDSLPGNCSGATQPAVYTHVWKFLAWIKGRVN